jgi:hypothetical protein
VSISAHNPVSRSHLAGQVPRGSAEAGRASSPPVGPQCPHLQQRAPILAGSSRSRPISPPISKRGYRPPARGRIQGGPSARRLSRRTHLVLQQLGLTFDELSRLKKLRLERDLTVLVRDLAL